MIYIIRHGQTDQNVAHRIQGQRDFPLNATGVAQAEAARDELTARGIVFDKVYSSPLGRAAKTAEIVSGGKVKPVFDDRLKEMDFGRFEGTDLEDMPEDRKFFFKDFTHNPAPEGVEQLADLKARLGAFLEDMKKDLLAEAGDAETGDADAADSADAAGSTDTGAGTNLNVLISTHAIALKAAMEYLTPDACGKWWMTFVKNCAVYSFDLVDGEFTVPVEVI